jgi:predicted RNA binding protein YcfA (HicA-like mRNA interferase family)
MSKSRVFSSDEVVEILLKEGFLFISQKGSHVKFRRKREGYTATVIVPVGRNEIPRGTLRSIIRQSGLPEDVIQ